MSQVIDVKLEDNLQEETQARPSPLAVLRSRNFRLLWIGEAISLLGDQFYMIALPWLVLQLTGNALAVGTVLAVAAIPRALFMLVGGALVDRFSPRSLMLGSNLVRFGLVVLLAGLVLTGTIELWMLYVMALFFGLADAFFYPAQSAIVPQLVKERDLPTANALVQGTAQLSLFVGPMLAGGLIALFANSQSTAGSESIPALRGIGLAFAIDAATFLASAATLWLIKIEKTSRAGAEEEAEPVLAAIKDILTYVWRDETLRYFFIIVAAVATVVNSLLIVGVPVLADSRYQQGAAAFGLIMSAYGFGSLLGIILAGTLPRPPQGHFGTILLVVTGMAGLGLVLMGLAATVVAAALTALFMGASLGYVVIQFITWIQLRTPEQMLGRMMSILMFASQGLVPVGMALAGVLLGINPTGLFIAAGLLLVLVTLIAVRNPAVRMMDPVPAA